MLIFSLILEALLGFISNKLPKSQSRVHIVPEETNR
jgi:hypothetical protein